MSDSKTRCAFYLRSSTEQQDPTIQLPDIARVAKQRDYEVAETYVERVSSSARRRPEFERLKKDAFAGRFSVVVVSELSRLSRSLRETTELVFMFDKIGVRLVSATQPFLDLDNPALRELLLAVFGFVSEMERSQLRARTRQGLASAKARGIRVGRPPVQYDIAELRRLRSEGHSFAEIARVAGIGKSTAHRLITQDEMLRSA